ncbi:hypothetical protein Psi02_72350 [Planotetraspora silvatica]|uniref:DNA-binding protein n=2 Tax=Planotetraspora silvatica TaxID=234614 RepID=A0A8J3XSS4_9ACTN|nr:hypothetical protein Psi02_72350 [Planotetraspora silvatica]
MLGFRGHFSTRSRRYSTTLGDIRAERQEHARHDKITTGRSYPALEVLMTSELLTVPEGMAALKVSRWTVYCLIRSGELPSVVVNVRCRRIPALALDAYVTQLCEGAA